MNTAHEESNALQAVSGSQVDAPRINAGALMMDIPTMESLMRVANLMASGKSTIPKHLQDNPADCMAVAMQSMQWGMNPFAVAQKTHLVGGTLGYEAQLVNAVVQESGAIAGRFHYEYKELIKGDAVECRVGAIIKGESGITWGEWLNSDKVTIKNSPLWKTNPKQQMGYLQVKNWARLHTPGAILGVYTPDEFETPAPRHMGAATVVQPTASPELIDAARAAADKGREVFGKYWKQVSASERGLLRDEVADLKRRTEAADKARTVDTPPARSQPKPQAAPTGQPDADGVIAPTKSFDDVMALLCAAASEDALYVASEWIEGIDDDAARALLNGKFDERLAQVRGAV